MKRFMSILVLFSFVALLFGCGGGSSSSSVADTTAPTVTGFSLPTTASSLTVAVTALTATDATAVTGYMITTSATAPIASAAGWSATAPTSVTFSAAGSQTAYAWAKDAAGNISVSRSATVSITLAAARQVNGVVTNPVSGLPLGGATVSVYIQNLVAKTVAAAAVPVTTVTTNADGSYSVTGLNAGVTYNFEISASGYATFSYYNINPDANNTLTLENVRALPSTMATQTATASGKVKNAATNDGLSNMTVKIRSGVNNKTGAIVNTATTDATGAYSFASLAAGTYTAEVTGNIGNTAIITSYFTLVSFPGTAYNANQDFPVTTPLSSTGSGQYRIVLNWGSDPRDLDSHLTGPTATTDPRFHIYFSSQDYPSGSSVYNTVSPYNQIAGPTTEAFLDVDNTSHGVETYSDNGPETTTIVMPRTGTYRFYVHHYSGASTISSSGAQVKVYKGSALLATFNPPAGAIGYDDVWNVFTMTVTSSGETISPVNSIDPTRGTSGLPKPVIGLEDYLLFSNLPVK